MLNVPSSVNSSQVEKRFDKRQSPLASPDLNLPVPGDVGELSAAAKKQLEENKFVLKSVAVDGATVFTDAQLKATYKNKIGETISLLDAREIAKKITDLYRKNGYILSQAVIPAQDLKNGVLKVRVVEGFVGAVVIDGTSLSAGQKKVIQAYADKINATRPVKTQDLERYLLLMNDLPGATVTGLLRPSANNVGSADLVLKVNDKAFEGAYTLDNRGSKYIGPWQHSVNIGANSLLGMYDQTQLRLNTTSPTTELRAFELSHSELLDSEGTELSLRASHTHTEPGDTLKPLQIVGDSDLYEIKVSHPFIRSRQENLVSRISFELHNSDTNVFKDVDFTEDRLRIARVGSNYNFIDDYQGNNFFDLQVSQGMNVFNASEDGVDRTNAIGESDFTKLNFDISRLQGLTNQLSLLAAASSQYSFDPLLVAEQFSVGGSEFGRAYDPAEVLGDSGIAGKLELRLDNQIGDEYLQDIQFYTYYDLGRVWLRNVPTAANDKKSIASAGFGARTNLTDNFSGNLEVAFPLTKPASNQSGDGKDPRVFAGFTAQF
jgi:hemolysin activation/secretion protein